jgi:hypothetical protein
MNGSVISLVSVADLNLLPHLLHVGEDRVGLVGLLQWLALLNPLETIVIRFRISRMARSAGNSSAE